MKKVTKHDFLRAKGEINAVFEDENIIIINKPVGVIVHEDKSEFVDTLINRTKKYLYDKGEYNPEAENSFAPALCNRIDRNTEGLVIAAKNFAALTEVNRIIKNRELIKKYLLICHDRLPKNTDKLTHFLLKDSDRNMVFAVKPDREGAQTAILYYNLIEKKEHYSLAEVKLVTGRTHQIRVQFKAIGHPLLGDTKYGKATTIAGKKLVRQQLCSYSLTLNPPEDSFLSYLSGREFKIERVSFLDSVWKKI